MVAEAEGDSFASGVDVPELEVSDGYSRWSTSYDAPNNPSDRG
jgi:hypothetical protein